MSANQIRVCVDGTANLHCVIRKQFAYCLPQTEIELDAPGVLCSPQVHRKLINRVPSVNCLVLQPYNPGQSKLIRNPKSKFGNVQFDFVNLSNFFQNSFKLSQMLASSKISTDFCECICKMQEIIFVLRKFSFHKYNFFFIQVSLHKLHKLFLILLLKRPFYNFFEEIKLILYE